MSVRISWSRASSVSTDIETQCVPLLFVLLIVFSKIYVTILQYTGYGMKQPVGHVDFYPNGGQKQPGCSLMDIENSFDITTQPDDNVDSLIRHIVACHHTMAIKFYIDSVDSYKPESCVYVGFECKSYDEFKQARH